MLDKTIPIKHIVMKMNATDNTYIDEPSLPNGFSFRLFKKGDEKFWAGIETSVLEFDCEEKALEYFSKDFGPRLTEMEKRSVFIVNEVGIPVATATAWWYDKNSDYKAVLHWVAVRPEYQGRGLGEAVVKKALQLFDKYEKGKDIYLNTQTWSHVAIQLYYKLGFKLLKTGQASSMENEYGDAVEILKNVIESNLHSKLIKTSI